VFSPGLRFQCVPLDWGGRGESGSPIQLVCTDNARAAMRFPHARNAPATVGVAPTSAGGAAGVARAAPAGRQFRLLG
jgi:hypothetical protein